MLHVPVPLLRSYTFVLVQQNKPPMVDWVLLDGNGSCITPAPARLRDSLLHRPELLLLVGEHQRVVDVRVEVFRKARLVLDAAESVVIVLLQTRAAIVELRLVILRSQAGRASAGRLLVVSRRRSAGEALLKTISLVHVGVELLL